MTEYLSGIMINIRKTRKECTGPVWGGCAKNVMKVIKNKTIYTGNGVIEDGFVRYEKTIAEVGSMQNFVSREEDEIVEVEGMYLIPGFIDVHSHGGYGLDSMDASADEIDWMVRQMAAKEGITSYFCTTMTQTSENIESAMKNLREKEHITVTKEGFIYLTESGKAIADMIYERHKLLTAWLTQLGVDEAIAAEDACRMEHIISKESFEAIKNHIESHSRP